MQPGAGLDVPTATGRRDRAPHRASLNSAAPNLDFMYFETADRVEVTVFNYKRNHVNKCSTQYVSVGYGIHIL